MDDVVIVAVDLLYRFYKDLYKKEPILAYILVFSLLVFILGVFGVVLSISFFTEPAQIPDSISISDVQEKIAELNQVSQSLENLERFIEGQKQIISSQQQELQSLTDEKAELEPIVKAYRETVNAVFEQQEKRARKQNWINLGLGFFLGVFSSLVASVLMRFYDKLKEQKANPTTAND